MHQLLKKFQLQKILLLTITSIIITRQVLLQERVHCKLFYENLESRGEA